MTPVATPHSCGYRTAMPGDEDEATGPACGKPAEWRHCVLLVPVCTEHRCRCRTPIETSRSPVGGTYPKLSEKIYSERNWLRCKDDWVAHAVELEKVWWAAKELLDEVDFANQRNLVDPSAGDRRFINKYAEKLRALLVEPPTDGRTSSEGEEREP